MTQRPPVRKCRPRCFSLPVCIGWCSLIYMDGCPIAPCCRRHGEQHLCQVFSGKAFKLCFCEGRPEWNFMRCLKITPVVTRKLPYSETGHQTRKSQKARHANSISMRKLFFSSLAMSRKLEEFNCVDPPPHRMAGKSVKRKSLFWGSDVQSLHWLMTARTRWLREAVFVLSLTELIKLRTFVFLGDLRNLYCSQADVFPVKQTIKREEFELLCSYDSVPFRRST